MEWNWLVVIALTWIVLLFLESLATAHYNAKTATARANADIARAQAETERWRIMLGEKQK